MRRPKNWDPNTEVDAAVYNLVLRTEGVFDGIEMYGNLREVDRSRVAEWVDQLRLAEANVRRAREQLTAVIVADDRACPVCGNGVVGRSDRRFCSTACRVRAHRRTEGR